MKNRLPILAALLCMTVLGLGLLSTAGAIVTPNTGATIIPAAPPITVTAYTGNIQDAVSPLNLTQKTSGDYPFQYATTLNMNQIWSSFNLMKAAFTFSPTGTPWNEVLMAGYLTLTLQLDPKVTVDASEFSVAKVQAAYDAANSGTTAGAAFIDYWTVNTTSYDNTTHILTVQLQMHNLSGLAPAAPDDQWVLASTFETIQPPMLYVATPAGALKVAAADFAVGSNFVTNSSLEGDFVFGTQRNYAVHISANVS
ncbi:MAG: hypothetical protein LBU47_00890, partial [Christensenellaceae bacterium]|nr:hypothetical protein [Christensenellaceae bacterium]